MFKGGWTTVTTPSPAHVWEAAETRIRIAEHLDFLPSGLPRGTSEAITAPSEKQFYLISTDCVLLLLVMKETSLLLQFQSKISCQMFNVHVSLFFLFFGCAGSLYSEEGLDGT